MRVRDGRLASAPEDLRVESAGGLVGCHARGPGRRATHSADSRTATPLSLTPRRAPPGAPERQSTRIRSRLRNTVGPSANSFILLAISAVARRSLFFIASWNESNWTTIT